jgi:hypothetical protein
MLALRHISSDTASMDIYKNRRSLEIDEDKAWFAEASSEDINDKVFDSYQELLDGMMNYILSLRDEEVDEYLSESTNKNYSNFYGATHEQIKTRVLQANSYEEVSNLALERFIEDGIKDGDFTNALNLVDLYKDPKLAQIFLSALKQKKIKFNGTHSNADRIVIEMMGEEFNQPIVSLENALLKHARKKYEYKIEQLKKINSDETGILDAVKVGIQAIRPNQQINKIIKKEVFQPLEEISQLPPLVLQIMKQLA